MVRDVESAAWFSFEEDDDGGWFPPWMDWDSSVHEEAVYQYRETGEMPSLGALLPGYESWRRGQDDAVERIFEWAWGREQRVEWQDYYGRGCPAEVAPVSLRHDRSLQVEAPTGSGKSVIAVAVARLLGRGCVVLTATKQLQDQYASTIPGAATLKGKTAFGCPRYEGRSPGMTASEAGSLCQACPLMRDGRCDYWRQYFAALNTLAAGGVVICNYSKWENLSGDGRWREVLERTAPLLVMDESDRLLDVATRSGTFDRTFRWLEHVAGLEDHPGSTDEEQWQNWLPDAASRLESREEELRTECRELEELVEHSDAALARFRGSSSIAEELKRAGEVFNHLMYGEFVCRPLRLTQGGGGPADGVELLPVAPSESFQGVVDREECSHVLMLSATPLPPLMLERFLGIKPLQFSLEPAFDPSRAPIRVSSRAVNTSYSARSKDPRLISEWAEATLGEVVSARERDPGLNALVYARSGVNRDALLAVADSVGLDVLSYRGHGGDRERAIARLSSGDRGLTLLGTGVERGLSLDGDACRLVVLGKAPVLPPPREDRLSARRVEMFPGYREVLEANDFAQVVGRAMRSEDDWCEVVITDGLWGWWVRDRKQYLSSEVRARLAAGAAARAGSGRSGSRSR